MYFSIPSFLPFLLNTTCMQCQIRRHLARDVTLGRRNWLSIGSDLAGERAAIVMSLVQSAKLNGRNPWAYLKDVPPQCRRS